MKEEDAKARTPRAAVLVLNWPGFSHRAKPSRGELRRVVFVLDGMSPSKLGYPLGRREGEILETTSSLY